MKKRLIRIGSFLVLVAMVAVLFTGCYEMIYEGWGFRKDTQEYFVMELYQDKSDDKYEDDYKVVVKKLAINDVSAEESEVNTSYSGFTLDKLRKGIYMNITIQRNNKTYTKMMIFKITSGSIDKYNGRLINAAGTASLSGRTWNVVLYTV